MKLRTQLLVSIILLFHIAGVHCNCRAINGVYFEPPVDDAAAVSPATAQFSVFYKAATDLPAQDVVNVLTEVVADKIISSLFASCRSVDDETHNTVDLQRVSVQVKPANEVNVYEARIFVEGAVGMAQSEVKLADMHLKAAARSVVKSDFVIGSSTVSYQGRQNDDNDTHPENSHSEPIKHHFQFRLLTGAFMSGAMLLLVVSLTTARRRYLKNMQIAAFSNMGTVKDIEMASPSSKILMATPEEDLDPTENSECSLDEDEKW
jgi:hypothetical protein